MSRSSFCTPTQRTTHPRSLTKPLSHSQNRLLKQNRLTINKKSVFGEEVVELIDHSPSFFPQSSHELLQQIKDISSILTSQGLTSGGFSLDQLDFAIKNQHKINEFLNHSLSHFNDQLLFLEIYANFFGYRLKVYTIDDLCLNCVFFGPKQARPKLRILQNGGYYCLLDKFVPSKTDFPAFQILYREEVSNEPDHRSEKITWTIKKIVTLDEFPSACYPFATEAMLEQSSSDDSDFEGPVFTRSTKFKKRIYGSRICDGDCAKGVIQPGSPSSAYSFRDFLVHSDKTHRAQVGRLVFYNHRKGFGGLQNPEGQMFFFYGDEINDLGPEINDSGEFRATNSQFWFEFNSTSFIMDGLAYQFASRLIRLQPKSA